MQFEPLKFRFERTVKILPLLEGSIGPSEMTSTLRGTPKRAHKLELK